jgi:hypothetical protein
MDLIVVVVLVVVRLIPTGDVVEFGGGDLASAGQAKPNFEGARRARTARMLLLRPDAGARLEVKWCRRL